MRYARDVRTADRLRRAGRARVVCCAFVVAHFSNPNHYSPFPTRHLTEFAIYDEVRPDPTQAPTGLVLKPGEESKRWVDEFGNVKAPPSSFAYLPAQPGEGGTLTEKVYEDTYLSRTYTNKITWHNRLGSAFRWQTVIEDADVPSTFTLEWLVIDGADFEPAGPPGSDRGLPGTGAGKQVVEYNQERWNETDPNLDTLAHHNPNQMGAGQAQDRDSGGPFAGYLDNYSRRRVYGGPPIHFHAGDDFFEWGSYLADFRGDGTAVTGNVGHSNYGDGPTSPRIWPTRKVYQRITPNWGKGTLATSAMIHRTDYWLWSAMPWDTRGVSGPIINGLSHNQSTKPLFFTKGFIIDLALGADSAIDVDLLSGLGVTYAPPGPGVFHSPAWIQDRNNVFIFGPNPFAQTVETLELAASPYRAAVMYDPVNNIAIAHAVKLGDVLLESGHPQAKIDGRPAEISLNRFINPDTTGSTTQGFADNIQVNSKSHGVRPPGWVGTPPSFTVIGTLTDVRDALNELFTSGAFDDGPVTDLPPALTAGTIWPPGSAEPTPLGEALIVFITGDSQAVAGEKAYLLADENPELTKLQKESTL